MNCRPQRICLLPCLALMAVLAYVATQPRAQPQADAKAACAKAVAELAKAHRQAYPNVEHLSVEQFLRRNKDKDWVVVDARSDPERKVSIIPGALSTAAFEARIDAHRGKRVLVYCTVGQRSSECARRLREQGLAAFNLEAGVLAWALAGKEFATPKGEPTRKVHVHSRKWNVLPPGYEAEW